MRQHAVFLIAALLLRAGNAGAGLFSSPDSYQSCVLDTLPGALNDTVAVERVMQCRKEFPGYTAPPENPATWFGPTTRSECVLHYAASTPSSFAAIQIREACYFLFGN
ncbi:hypothetical protein F6R98_14160 [Candidatus Methylospira mobilis]|uniref:Uncharacterized protein n=1 Tax=Candidatus Methylospira mobilis TaxID=1808979 RepID=A0A5Q0BN42_9GAMM|nr:hypothetical protein [Candidatus Methylospira mobilis]QFY43624.1 hypothetical protein F6R98_14160 [Candidatus Methylospira mobilis]WNV04613.1 hypothetical protein RP726_19810 [Candidatus Methylospira mobilis]